MRTMPLYVGGASGYDQIFASVTGAFIPLLLDAARIAAGHRVPGVATGTGAAEGAAAELVGPTGEIIAGDISSTMLDVAIRNPENSTPERSLFTRVGTVIGKHVPAKAEPAQSLRIDPNDRAPSRPAAERRV